MESHKVETDRLGMFVWFGYRLPLEERLALIARAGFSSTCLWLGEEEELVAAGTAERMPVMARETGLLVDNVHAPFVDCNDVWSESSERVTAVIEGYSTALTYCAQHEIPKLVVHVSKGSTPPPPNQCGLDAIGGLVLRAETLGVTLAVENTRSPLHSDFLFSRIASRHLGLCYDSSHDFISGQPRCVLLKDWGSRLATTHLSDNNGLNDDHYLPGDGGIAWELVGNAFPVSTYSGPIMLEVVSQDISRVSSEQFVLAAYERATRIAKLLS